MENCAYEKPQPDSAASHKCACGDTPGSRADCPFPPSPFPPPFCPCCPRLASHIFRINARGQHVRTRQGRQGTRQGRRQAPPQGAARQHPGNHGSCPGERMFPTAPQTLPATREATNSLTPITRSQRMLVENENASARAIFHLSPTLTRGRRASLSLLIHPLTFSPHPHPPTSPCRSPPSAASRGAEG
jgi:hypothetical protein